MLPSTFKLHQIQSWQLTLKTHLKHFISSVRTQPKWKFLTYREKQNEINHP